MSMQGVGDMCLYLHGHSRLGTRSLDPEYGSESLALGKMIRVGLTRLHSGTITL